MVLTCCLVRLLDVLDRIIQFKGLGVNSNLDVLYVKQSLKEIVKEFGYLCTKVVLKLPCNFLEHSEMIIGDYGSAKKRNKRWQTSLSLSSSVSNIVLLSETKMPPSLMYLFQGNNNIKVFESLFKCLRFERILVKIGTISFVISLDNQR